MSEEGKNVATTTVSITDQPNQQYPPYYGTFQGVANFYPHPHPHPQPLPSAPTHVSPYNYYQGYNALPIYAVVEGRPVRERRLPCCGLGLGWLLFILGFFLGGIPWYVGTFFLLCVQIDYREKPGLIACTVVSLIVMMVVTLGVPHRNLSWRT